MTNTNSTKTLGESLAYAGVLAMATHIARGGRHSLSVVMAKRCEFAKLETIKGIRALNELEDGWFSYHVPAKAARVHAMTVVAAVR
jgi:hypothetical protein